MLGTRCFPEKAFRGMGISRIRIDLGNLARLANSRVRERGACTEGVKVSHKSAWGEGGLCDCSSFCEGCGSFTLTSIVSSFGSNIGPGE